METYRCPTCNDIILIVIDEEVNEQELNTKAAKHAQQHEELEKLYNNS